jgi:hypothetical protein
VVEVVDVAGTVVVVTQPPASHASQQLVSCPTQPSAQYAGSGAIEQRGCPEGLLRQQVTASGRPQVERAAHLMTLALH